MTKWEYRIVSYKGHIGELQKDLNQLGHDGFELVAIYNGCMFVKRPLIEPGTLTESQKNSQLAAVRSTSYDSKI